MIDNKIVAKNHQKKKGENALFLKKGEQFLEKFAQKVFEFFIYHIRVCLCGKRFGSPAFVFYIRVLFHYRVFHIRV